METKEVNHVYVWSVAKLYSAISLIISIVVGIVFTAAALVGMAPLPGMSTLAMFGSGVVIAVLAVVILAVIGMIGGFILGAVLAVIYNLAAGIFGGIRVDLE